MTSKQPPSRRYLRFQASIWRGLEALGTGIDRWAIPQPISHAFTRTVEVAPPFHKGKFSLYFYVPPNYENRPPTKQYPVILNFHGGGFTIGTATDDARWASYVLSRSDIGAVIVSVDYRLAPEHPYPIGVQDGVAALRYLEDHNEELGLDLKRVVMNGFSCGGNFAFTVSMMYYSLLRESKALEEGATEQLPVKPKETARIVAITAFYPCVDFTIGRAHKRASNPSQAMELPHLLTDLFDQSYLYSPNLNLYDPFLSPAVAEEGMLKEYLPDDVIIYTCEFDGLQEEGERFARKLEGLGKRVRFKMAKGVRHAWDKMPNVGWEKEGVRDVYKEVLDGLKEVIEMERR